MLRYLLISTGSAVGFFALLGLGWAIVAVRHADSDIDRLTRGL